VPGVKYVTDRLVNVRKNASDSADIAGTLPGATIVTAGTLIDPTRNRTQITAPIAGWVWSAYLVKVPVVLTPQEQFMNWAKAMGYPGPSPF
jgi:hypothetical protein